MKNASRKSTLQTTLNEAESVHLKDCPSTKPEVRAAAALLDVAFLIALSNALVVLAHSFERWMSLPDGFVWWLRAGLFVLLQVWPLSFARSSPGKQLLGVRVIRQLDGNPLSFGRALLRETLFKLLTAASVIGIYWFFRKRNPFALHDRLAGSASKRVHGVR
jgi:uncharacterized RDD family membrane protein YckC